MGSLPAPRDRTRRTRHALVVTAAVYVLLRAWSLWSLPLILTNDSVGYVDWAQTILGEGLACVDLDTKTFRTPGFPLVLAGVFQVFGMRPLAVLLAQRAFGCAACLGVTWLGCRLAGPRLGLTAGLLCCLDPGLFLFENFALTEVPAAALTVLLIAAVVGLRRTSLRGALAIGLLLGAAILVRPAFQLFVPFTLAAWLVRVRPEGWRSMALHLAGLAAGVCGSLGPWVAINQQRNHTFQVARGSGAFLWYGVQRAGLLKLDRCPDDAVIREVYRPYETVPLSDGEFRAYCRATDGMRSREPLLTRWALSSMAADVPAYLRWAARGLRWQLNLYPPQMLDETAWFFRHAARDGSAVCYTVDAPQVAPLIADNRVGVLGVVLRWWGERRAAWFPTLPLFVLALATIAGAVRAGRWDLALMFGATVATVLFHAALLSAPSRYTLPMAVAWYGGVAALPAVLVRGGLAGTRPRAAGGTADGARSGGEV